LSPETRAETEGTAIDEKEFLAGGIGNGEIVAEREPLFFHDVLHVLEIRITGDGQRLQVWTRSGIVWGVEEEGSAWKGDFQNG
jgi:hypothetical protein